MSGNSAIKGGGRVGPLMANAILNFHFDFLTTSLSLNPLTFLFGYLVTSTSFSTLIVIISEFINRYGKKGHMYFISGLTYSTCAWGKNLLEAVPKEDEEKHAKDTDSHEH